MNKPIDARKYEGYTDDIGTSLAPTDESALFYSPENIAYLKAIVEDIKSGKAVLSEHELIEE